MTPTPALPPPDALAPVAASPEALVLPGGWQIEGLPTTIRRAGPKAAERTVEFFTAQIRNPHTRAAYAAAVTRFFTWCDARGLALAQISPIAVATYIEDMQGRYRAPTIKQHLAAIRRLFDWLVTGQVCPPTRPPPCVHGQDAGCTCRTALLDTIHVNRPPRDRWPSTASPASRPSHARREGKPGGCGSRKKAGSTPCRSTTGGLSLSRRGRNEHDSPLWRSMPRAGGTDEPGGCVPTTRQDRWARRGRHTFRATGITAYLLNGGIIAAHESPRTTKL